MNAHLAFKTPENITTEQAATIGGGLLVCNLPFRTEILGSILS